MHPSSERDVVRVPLGPWDSADVAPAQWQLLADAVRSAAGACLITFGTDTLAWAAAALAACGPWEHPVVFTAANLPSGVDGSDATRNLRASLVALNVLPGGVWVVFAGLPGATAQVVQGGFARKLHADGACIVDVSGTPYATVPAGTDLLDIAGTLRPHPVADPGARFGAHVELVRLWPGFDPAPPRHLRPDSTVVVELYACATLPDRVVSHLGLCCAAGHLVLACPPAPLDAAHYPSTGLLADVGVHVWLSLTPELAAALASLRWHPHDQPVPLPG
jgi:hypothetical protein